MSDDIRIVIAHKGNGATIGVQRTGCDPAFFTVQGDLAAAVNAIPGFVEEAAIKWQTNQRYPKADLPSPPPATTQPPPAKTQSASTAPKTQNMF